MRTYSVRQANTDGRKRWWALTVVCLGVLMIVLDGTIVIVALPSIRAQVGFPEASITWVVNAYLLTFGGFLLLGGRLGDIFGHRRLFVIGIILFTLSSLICGLTNSQGALIGARAVQGMGGAVVSAVALSLIVNLFPEPPQRAKAMGLFGLVSSGGGSVGLLLGGTLTGLLNWHWIFLVNVPIGIAVYALCFALLPDGGVRKAVAHLDVAGAVTATVALMLANYAIMNGNDAGWNSQQTFTLVAGTVGLLIIFLCIERRARTPLIPLEIFRQRSLTVASISGAVWASALYAWPLICALYLQLILGRTPLQVAFAFLPANLIIAAFALGISSKLVARFGTKRPLMVGLLLTAAGLLLFARAPVTGSIVIDVLPSMLLVALGIGTGSNALLLTAMSGVAPSDSGLASGVVSTSFTLGGALGLAVLVSIAAVRTDDLLVTGAGLPVALNAGYHLASLIGAAFAIVAALVSATVPLTRRALLRDYDEQGAALPPKD